MPPRLPTLQRLSSFSLCLRPASTPATPSFLPIIHTANISTKEEKRRQRLDPYRWAQAQQRKTANIKKQEALQAERDATWGDPVHGIPTPFVESFDSAGQASMSAPKKTVDGTVVSEPKPLPTSPHMLGHLLTQQEFDQAIRDAYELSRPVLNPYLKEDLAEEEARQNHEKAHATAVEALKRITSLENSNSKIKKHVNIKRCIDEFGRHNTDNVLKPKPASINANTKPVPVRAGPDTGSSEVQIAILTMKIRKMSQELGQNRGYKDKHNKRNLRVLCHRRQALLRYMEKKERGTERWTNMLEKLGLSPATWKEQISL